MAVSTCSSPAEELTRLLVEGGRIECEEMQKVAGEELVAAAADGSLERLRALIAAGVDINATSKKYLYTWNILKNMTALMAAVKYRHAEVVSTLVQAGAELDVIAQIQGTALMLAAAQRDTKILRMLLESGADVNVTLDGYPEVAPNALSCAASFGNIEAIRVLLDAGADVNRENNEFGEDRLNALYYAALDKGHIEAVVLLLEAGSSVNVRSERGLTPLIAATSNTNGDIMRLLINAGADVNFGLPYGPLGAASSGSAYENRAEKLQILLEAGANLSGYEAGSVLLDIADRGDAESLRLLESTGVYLEPEFPLQWGPKALLCASWNGHVDVVQFLMQKGADIHVEDKDGLDAVMQAGSQEVLDLLLGAGAIISVDGGKKAKALWYAARCDRIALVRALLEAGVDINTQDPDDMETALMCAVTAYSGCEALPLLIAAGADLELRDVQGNTALLKAAEQNSLYAAGHLVLAGADTNVAANNAQTPLQHAVLNTNREMVSMLLSAGAKVCTETQPYVQAMHHYIAAVLCIFPPNFPVALRQTILHLILARSDFDGQFLKNCPSSTPWIEYLSTYHNRNPGE